jgi:hypothetical protein
MIARSRRVEVGENARLAAAESSFRQKIRRKKETPPMGGVNQSGQCNVMESREA